MATKLPKIPQLLDRKIYKTGQTRGADDDEIFQNRVGRNSTVLIPYSQFQLYAELLASGFVFENGFIVLISPDDYFGMQDAKSILAAQGLTLGENAVLFYETRQQWVDYNPESHSFTPAQSRTAPLNGEYVARIHATTAIENGGKIVAGFNTTSSKGAGIRAYEFGSLETINQCRQQLEAIFWLCKDSKDVLAHNGMAEADILVREKAILDKATENGLLDKKKLLEARIINENGKTVCPLCLEEVSAAGFFNKMEQALGREVHDLTITQLNLFHIDELRFGEFNHRPYNLGWGHHHCNVVVKDSGIHQTLDWMRSVIERNDILESKLED